MLPLSVSLKPLLCIDKDHNRSLYWRGNLCVRLVTTVRCQITSDCKSDSCHSCRQLVKVLDTLAKWTMQIPSLSSWELFLWNCCRSLFATKKLWIVVLDKSCKSCNLLFWTTFFAKCQTRPFLCNPFFCGTFLLSAWQVFDLLNQSQFHFLWAQLEYSLSSTDGRRLFFRINTLLAPLHNAPAVD